MFRPSCHRRLLSSTVTASRYSRFRVSEIFSSIQGEGPHSGRPSVFLRLGICNLACAWCDTPYTWLYSDAVLEKVRNNIETYGRFRKVSPISSIPFKTFDRKTELEVLSTQEVRSRILSLAHQSIRAVVITGGEPLLHAKPLLDLVPMLESEGFNIEIETNGTINPTGLSTRIHFNVSPKLSNSCQGKHIRINFKILSEFMQRPNAIFKFVIDSQADLEEVHEVVSVLSLPPSRVYLMPQGTEPSSLRAKGPWIAEICKSQGYNYSHRIHVELWGGRRGI